MIISTAAIFKSCREGFRTWHPSFQGPGLSKLGRLVSRAGAGDSGPHTPITKRRTSANICGSLLDLASQVSADPLPI
jgi:hypothetical protein